MKKVIENLVEAVKTSNPVDAVQTLHPKLSSSAAEGVVSDVKSYMDGNLEYDKLAMFLMKDGVVNQETMES